MGIGAGCGVCVVVGAGGGVVGVVAKQGVANKKQSKVKNILLFISVLLSFGW